MNLQLNKMNDSKKLIRFFRIADSCIRIYLLIISQKTRRSSILHESPVIYEIAFGDDVNDAPEWCKCKLLNGLCSPWMGPMPWAMLPMPPIEAIELIWCMALSEWWWWWWCGWILCRWLPYGACDIRPGSNFGLMSRPTAPEPVLQLPLLPPPTPFVSGTTGSLFFCCFLCLARRFWNQIFTCRSDNDNVCANSDFRRIVMYWAVKYSFSSSRRWWSV